MKVTVSFEQIIQAIEPYVGDIPNGQPRRAYIRIYTQYPNAWNESLHNLLGIYAVNGYINITMLHPTQNYIEINPGTKDIILQLNVIDIYVQIGQGWIQ